MRRGARNTAQMLGNIRGLTWNAVDNSVEYNGKQNIIVLVDSLEKGYSYVMNLHHVRFERVEIIDQPKGMYEGYDVLINLVTKKNYEAHLKVSTRLMPAGPNAGKFVFLVNDGAITYTRNKWNFVADAPLKWGDGINKTYVVFPAIQSTSYFSSWKSNNRGALQLSLTYRFMGGNSVREYNREMSDER